MANLRDRLLLFKECPNDAQVIGIVPDILRRSPARDHKSDVIGRVYVCEREIGIPTLTRFLGVSIEAGFTIVDDEVQFFLWGQQF